MGHAAYRRPAAWSDVRAEAEVVWQGKEADPCAVGADLNVTETARGLVLVPVWVEFEGVAVAEEFAMKSEVEEVTGGAREAVGGVDWVGDMDGRTVQGVVADAWPHGDQEVGANVDATMVQEVAVVAAEEEDGEMRSLVVADGVAGEEEGAPQIHAACVNVDRTLEERMVQGEAKKVAAAAVAGRMW